MIELEQQAAEFQARSAYLDNAEAVLSERQIQLADGERALERDRLAFENLVTRERRELAAEADQGKCEIDQRRRGLEKRDQALDQREKSLEEVAEQLRAAQRETLETRLATEETWLQLQGVLAPAALQRSIAIVRGRLSDHFQMAAEEVVRRRQELETVRAELAEQFEEIHQRREQVERWADDRRHEVEQQAARLVAKERRLDELESEFTRQERRWEIERAEYQQEIQRLLADLRRPLSAAA
jgi:hypothetical protein